MSDEWYFSNDGQQSGPVSTDQMQQLVTSGEITSKTLLWHEDLSDWTPAEKVEGVFPASARKRPGPPPLKNSTSNSQQDDALAERGRTWLNSICQHLGKLPDESFISWSMKPKPGSRLALSIAGTLAALGVGFLFLVGAIVIQPLIGVFFFCLWLSGVGLLAVIVNLTTYGQKKQQLLGLWDAVGSDLPSIQFTTDGNLIRLDGASGEYQYSVFGETLIITIPPASPVKLRVVLISKHELHLSDGNGVSHYKKGKTLTDEELEKEMAAARENMIKVGKVAGRAALVAAGVTAVAGMAVLGGVATASTLASEGGSGVPPGMRACPGCGRAVPGTDSHSGKLLQYKCGNCGTPLHYN